MKKIFTILSLVFVSSFAHSQYSTLYDFTGNGAFNGESPDQDQNFISDGTYLYGMTRGGGENDEGTIFKIMLDGTSHTVLHNFNRNSSGAYPRGSLFYDGTFLYGTTNEGGDNDDGIIFKIKPDGTGFVKLFDFDYNISGSRSYSTLISDGTFLYGTTNGGGDDSEGTVFKIMPDGSSFQTLVHFDENLLGGGPRGSLFYDGIYLYGTTENGGDNSDGTIFRVKPDGTGDTTLFSFDGSVSGRNPYCSLLLSGTYFYGMTNSGGDAGYGVIFKIMPDGTAFDTIMTFRGTENGSSPYGSLISDGTFLYGMTAYGGMTDEGTIFKIMPDGTGYIKLKDFDSNISEGTTPYGSLFLNGTTLFGMTNSGGENYKGTMFSIKTDGGQYKQFPEFTGALNGGAPVADLLSDGTYLYGTASNGGTFDAGVIFKIKHDGTGYTKLYDFDGIDGYGPTSTLVSDGTYLFGTTQSGGINYFGTIFKIKKDGTGFTNIFEFDNTNTGANPRGSLIIDNSVLFGMTSSGGTNNGGTVYRINSDGSAFAKLKDFTDTINGRSPQGALIFDGTFLYGMTTYGGDSARGIIFRIKPDNTGFTKLHNFGVTAGDGIAPFGSLISDGVYLYGMTVGGGNGTPYPRGTIFKIKADGSAYSTVHDFTGSSGGSQPRGSLLLVEDTLYGMTSYGGGQHNGIMFKISPSGSNYNVIKEFVYGEGFNPFGSLIAEGGALYGTTRDGGKRYAGSIFKYQYCSPVMANASNDTLCVGALTTLSGAGATTYTWSNGVNDGVEFAPSATSTYTVTGTGVGVCTANTDTITIKVNLLPTVITTANPSNATVCTGSQLTLSGGGASTYNWSNSVFDNSAFVPSAGTYTVTGTDANGCSGTSTIAVTVNSYPDLTTTLNGIVISANQAGASYIWINCATNTAISGETAQTFTATVNGNYAVVVDNGNCGDTSACVNIMTVGFRNNNVENTGINIFPNPTTGVFNIVFTNSVFKPTRVKVVGVIGNVVYNEIVTNNTQVDLMQLSSGTYFVTIETSEKSFVYRIIKE